MHKNKKFNTLSGFGLIELMVSISIVVLVTSIIIARHDSYNGAVLLRSQAYDIALKIREVQMQAVSAIGDEDNFRRPLGVCFNTTTPNYYHIFADDGDGVCEVDEYIGQRGNIDPRFKIESLKLDGFSEDELAILFESPNFDARFFVGNKEQTDVDAVEIGLVRLGADKDSTSAGDLRVMEISRTGQILVQPVNKTTSGQTCTGDDCPKECEKLGNCDNENPPCPEKGCDDGGGGTIDLPGGGGDDGAKEDGGGGSIELPPDNPEEQTR